MATNVNSLAAWAETRDTLGENLHSVLELLAHAPFSADPASVYVRAESEQTRLLGEMRRHAVAGIRQIDDAIAASGVIGEINGLSAEARREADLIKNAAKTIDGITGAVNLVAGVVAKFASLPFL
jgi:hypothetical protein